MSRFSSSYVCQQCGYVSMGYMGKCPECNNWNTLVETVTENSKSKTLNSKQSQISISNLKSIRLSDVKASDTNRISTNISELDRVLGGGLVLGQAILIAGEPGIGKSTLLTQVADSLKNVLYVCGEESPSQIAVRAKRMGITSKNIELLESTDADVIVESFSKNNYSALIVDSIQTVTTQDLTGMAGSVGQVRESASRLVRAAKENNTPLFLVGHVTKEGTVAGPAVLAHIVDTVLWFEGDKTYTTRILRAVKNRFGPTDEVGIFEMVDTGLKSVSDIDNLFLDKNEKSVAGSIVTSVMQGTRPILVEIQALVVPTKLPIPRRVGQGVDSKRLEMLLAVLTRRCGIPLYEQDVFVNIAGGFKTTEPASDLAICLAIASSHFEKTIPNKTLAMGEVGLLGEVRSVVQQVKRIKEAKRLGYKNVISSDFKYLNQVIKELFK